MTAATEQQVAEYGNNLMERVIRELAAVPDESFAGMQEIKNLAGEVTGFAHVYTADKIRRISHLSINIAPGMRYFNLMVCPEDNVSAPRFMHEGMVSVHGSQISTDMFHDVDMLMNVQALVAKTAGLTEIFDEAKASDLNFVPSRQTHMRMFASPHFLNMFGVNGDQLDGVAGYADRYFSEWLSMLGDSDELDPDAAATRRKRREHMSDMVVHFDPDRHMVVQVYGEETVQAIENACMY